MAALMNTRKAAFGQRVRASPARSLVVRRVASGEPDAAGNPEVIEYIKTLPGISAPFDSPYFDPAGLSKTARTVAEVRRWRESELVHGRVAMLAALGFIIGEQLEDFPAFFNADGHITGPAIYQFQQVEARGGVFWEPLVFAIGLAESYRVGVAWATPKGTAFNTLKGEDEYSLGDLGFDPLGLKPTDPAALKDIETKELNNGRLAMIAIAAFTAQELVSQQEIFEHLALRLEKEAILELDDVERDVGAPITSVPALVIEELSK